MAAAAAHGDAGDAAALAALRSFTKKHPARPGASAQIPRGDFVSGAAGAAPFLSAADRAQFAELGYCILRGAIPRPDVAAVRGELDRHEARIDAWTRRQPGGKSNINVAGQISFAPGATRSSAVCERFSRHPVFQGVCRDLIRGRPRLYNDQAVYKKPSPGRHFPWHQDNGYTFIQPEPYVTCWVPLTDATLVNGCPWVVPRAHRLGTLAHSWNTEMDGWEVDGLDAAISRGTQEVSCPVAAGDVIVFSSLTPHRTGPNSTAGEVRKAYILQYVADGARFVATADGTEMNGGRGFGLHPRRNYFILDEDRGGGTGPAPRAAL